MKNTAQIKVSPDLLNNSQINDEYLFRDLARKMVSEMPLDELHKLINFKKIDPNSEDSQKTLTSSMNRFKIEQILHLRYEGVILYSSECNLL